MKMTLDYGLLDSRIWSNTYNALKYLIDNSYYAQLAFPKNNLHLTNSLDFDKGYFNEFCTVRMCTARRSGHTTALCRVAKEYFDKVIFLSPNLDMSKKLWSHFRSLPDNCEFSKVIAGEISTNTGGRYLFGSHLALDKFRGVETEAVFVDGTFSLNAKEEEEIYSCFASCMKKYPQKFFVFVQ